jgi:hypothetical protein
MEPEVSPLATVAENVIEVCLAVKPNEGNLVELVCYDENLSASAKKV